jgi:hypothetical protein
MLETELAAKEAKIASGKLAAVKAIKRGLARWVWPAKNCPLLSISFSTPPGWPEKVLRLFVLLASSLGYGIMCSFVDDKISMLTLLYHWITTSFHTLIIHSRLRSC